MPATVLHDPLAVRFVFPDSSTWTSTFDGLPNPVLAQDLAIGLAANAHPHGGIGARNTAKVYAVNLRKMARWMSSAGFHGGAADLTRPLLMQFWMANPPAAEMLTRLMLRGYDTETDGLRPDVRSYLVGAKVNSSGSRSRPYRAYTDGEWARLEQTLQSFLARQRTNHRQALAAAAQGSDPRSQRRARFDDICWLLTRNGPMSCIPDYRDYVRESRTRSGTVEPGSRSIRGSEHVFSQALAALFPRRDVQIAYATLLGMYSGIVPDGIDDLGLDDICWAGDASVLLSYFKGRTSQESSTLPRRAVRLLQQWLEHSELMRGFAPDVLRNQLWLSYNTKGYLGRPPDPRSQQRLVAALGLVDDTGSPLPLHRSRIRATYTEQLARRGWTGRASIDPNHAARTEGDHYVTPTTPAQLDAVESIIEDGQSDLLRKARPPVVLSDDQASEVAVKFPDEVRRLGLDSTALHELIGGERDVFTAACTDQLAGIHGPAGLPCPARPWVCLLCPLAVFLPRHAPNLLRINAYFSRQFRQMPTEQFMRVFGPYSDRLSNEILPRFSDAVKARAYTDLTDTDTDLPLRPEETTE
ncbi:hypothetical protein [Nocardia sp. NPDC059229]|uniref:hypothetical protein n=1 Tax=Nocardia sp. NPDC059229 TaxID=3346778 RepID=UPI0036A4B094